MIVQGKQYQNLPQDDRIGAGFMKTQRESNVTKKFGEPYFPG